MSLIGKRITVNGADFSDIKLDFETFVLDRIEITSQPAITTYHLQDAFDPTGMKVMAYYIGDISGKETYRNITDYTWDPADAFTVVGPQVITISYTDADITKTATLTVTVLGETTYDISSNITNGTATGASSIDVGGTANLTLIPNEANELPADITVTNAEYTYNNMTGAIVLSNATAAVTITASCPERTSANLVFSLPGGYNRDGSQALTLNIRGTYYGNLHKGDIVEYVDEPYGNLDWAIVIDGLTGTTGVQYDSTCVDNNTDYINTPLYTTGRWVVSEDHRFALTCCYIIGKNPTKANTEDLPAAAMSKFLKITWANSRNNNNPVSDTGNIPVTSYTITGNITKGTMTGATTLVEGNTATVTIVPNTGCSLPDTITVTNAQYTYDSTTGEVVLSNGTGNITIIAVCEGEIPATENLTFSIGAYTWDTSTYAPNTKIRATYFGNLHAGDVISMSPDAKAGTQYQYVFSPLAGTSGHQSADNTVRQAWADAGVQVTGMPNAHYEDVPVTIPLDGRVAVTIKDNNAASANISESELAKIFQITWIDPTDPTNDSISKP